jgi:catechol 2,3-dioxygenase-like lactoylglutathione lyase family enzyme
LHFHATPIGASLGAEFSNQAASRRNCGFAVRDPDGYLIEVGQTSPEFLEQIA